jgi:hypothetical protein
MINYTEIAALILNAAGAGFLLLDSRTSSRKVNSLLFEMLDTFGYYKGALDSGQKETLKDQMKLSGRLSSAGFWFSLAGFILQLIHALKVV